MGVESVLLGQVSLQLSLWYYPPAYYQKPQLPQTPHKQVFLFCSRNIWQRYVTIVVSSSATFGLTTQ